MQTLVLGVCSSVGRAAISKVAGRGFESLRTRLGYGGNKIPSIKLRIR